MCIERMKQAWQFTEKFKKLLGWPVHGQSLKQ